MAWAAVVSGQPVDINLATELAGLNCRPIGPASMGGRVADIAAVDAKTFYVAVATGNLWKTTNRGTTWEALFEDEEVNSLGDVAIAPLFLAQSTGGRMNEEDLDSISDALDALSGLADLIGAQPSLAPLISAIEGATTRPTSDQLGRLEDAWQECGPLFKRLNELIGEAMPGIYRWARASGLILEPVGPVRAKRQEGPHS